MRVDKRKHRRRIIDCNYDSSNQYLKGGDHMTWQESVVQALSEGVSNESILRLAETKTVR